MPNRLEDIAEARSQNIIDSEIALANSAWAVANGHRLTQVDRTASPEPREEPKD